MANAVVAAERIRERVPIPRSKRTKTILRYAPGNVVTPEDVERLGVKPDGTQPVIPTADGGSDVSVPLPAKKAAKKATKKATAKKRAPAKKAAAKKPAPRKRK